MTVYNNLMEQIDNAGLLFNVKEVNLYAELNDLALHGQEGARLIEGKKALVNCATDKVMSVVSRRYKVVTNEEIFNGFCKAIETSGIDAADATVNVRQTPTGSRAMVDFIFPNESIVVGDSNRSDDSSTALQFCALNSFDGSTRYITKAGGLRMKCLNGQILGSIVGAYSSTHTQNLDVEAGAARVVHMVQEFQQAKEYWTQMMRTPCGITEAERVFVQFLGMKDFDWQNRKNSRLERCLELWHEYANDLGRNAYAVYNVLTHYVSHQSKQYKNPVKTMISQRQRVEKALDKMPIFSSSKDSMRMAA